MGVVSRRLAGMAIVGLSAWVESMGVVVRRYIFLLLLHNFMLFLAASSIHSLVKAAAD